MFYTGYYDDLKGLVMPCYGTSLRKYQEKNDHKAFSTSRFCRLAKHMVCKCLSACTEQMTELAIKN